MIDMLNFFKHPEVGSYEIWFSGSANGGGKLEFFQSPRSILVAEVITKDWEHHSRDRNQEKLKELNKQYTNELGLIVEKFHKEVEQLLEKAKDDLEKLK